MQPKIDFVSLTDDLLPQVVAIHSQAFAGQMNVKLGRKYLFHFFEWFTNYPNNISVIAIENGQSVRGYVIGAPLDYTSDLNRDLFWIAVESIILRPPLWVDEKIRTALIARARILMRLENGKACTPEIPLPSVSLVGIGVNPGSQKSGIGFQLMQTFEERAKALQMRSMRLSVFPENHGARRLYEKCGWTAYPNDVVPNKTMYYYKVIG